MSKLSCEDVLKLARLSRLKLSEEEIKRFQTELSEILGYVEVLSKADTTGLEPTYQLTGLKNVTRKDEIREYEASPEGLLAQAPAKQDNQFKVKRVL